jgi:hypothetical protein
MAALAALAVGGAASADPIYRWVDKDGQEHFTNDRASIPAGEKASITEGDELGELTVSKDPSEAPPPRARADRHADDSAAQNEQTWRARFKRVHTHIQELEARVVQDKEKADGAKDQTLSVDSTPGPRPYRHRADDPQSRTRDQLARDEAALKGAQDELAELERSASRQSVPQEWRQ